MRHILITSGLSELPVLVAARRLLEVEPAEAARVTLISSDAARTEAERVRELLADTGVVLPGWTVLTVNPDDPWDVRQKVRELVRLELSKADRDSVRYHLHFTGGKATMGVNALEALLIERIPPDRGDARFRYELSYLSSDDNLIRDGERHILSPRSEVFSWNLDVAQLAKLHGYRLTRPLAIPDRELIDIGRETTRLLLDRDSSRRYQNAISKWGKPDQNTGWKTFEPSKPTRKEPWPDLDPAQDWNALTGRIRSYFEGRGHKKDWLIQTGKGWEIDFSKLSRNNSAFARFMHGQCLELLAYDELVEALRETAPQGPPYAVATGVEFHELGKRKFELDVIAVLGYVLVAVSCSITSGDKSKQKAFEVMYRARQIGGVHARGVVLCVDDPGVAASAQKELMDDIGGRREDATVRVLGRDYVEDPVKLREAFKDYLSEIWKP
jgi:hypothetical protein